MCRARYIASGRNLLALDEAYAFLLSGVNEADGSNVYRTVGKRLPMVQANQFQLERPTTLQKLSEKSFDSILQATAKPTVVQLFYTRLHVVYLEELLALDTVSQFA